MFHRFMIGWVAPALILTACGAALTQQDKTELAEFEGELHACLLAHPQDKPSQDDCIARVKSFWHKRWNDRFDGGF